MALSRPSSPLLSAFSLVLQRGLLVFALLLLGCGAGAKNEPAAKEPVATPEATGEAPGTLLAGDPETPVPVESDDIVSGEGSAPVTIVAFLDYECAFCAQGFGRLVELRSRYDEKTLRIVIKQLPLEFHPEALPAAIAAQSIRLLAGNRAALDYSAKLFENQSHLGASAYAVFADQVGVERSLFNENLGDEETINRIGVDVMLAKKLGVEGTPAFFVNGRAFPGLFPLEELAAAVEEEKSAVYELTKTREARAAYAARVFENSARALVDALLAEDPKVNRVELGDAPRIGADDAKVTLVAFSDFECPYCKRAEATLSELRKIYGPDLRIVFKQYPLPFHKRAAPAARVALLVQRKHGSPAFFTFAARLFETAPALSDDNLRALGLEARLSPDEIESALADRDPELRKSLERDLAQADDLAVRGAPHFFVNGLRMSGARPLAHFRALIDEAKRRAEATRRDNPSGDLYGKIIENGALPGIPERTEIMLSAAGQPVRGPDNAPVTIHVWSDFECPFCRRVEPVLAELERDFPGKLRIVWHDLPLPFHDRARPAARLGQLVFLEKGSPAFYRYHSLAFDLEGSAPKLGRDELLAHAKSLGVDAKKAEAALDGTGAGLGALDTALELDATLAERIGIQGTPGFVVGDYVIKGALPKRSFARAIQLALERTQTPSTPK